MPGAYQRYELTVKKYKLLLYELTVFPPFYGFVKAEMIDLREPDFFFGTKEEVILKKII